ncbi:MAG: hypothetical protein IAE63_06170 [Alphaproteobacteria bacterium]|nr:hypothetical protein [Alphaproteobacteria bacterium]
MTSSRDAPFSEGWIHRPETSNDDLKTLCLELSSLTFDHHIANWRMVFITSNPVKSMIYPDCLSHGCEALAVFCVDVDAWGRRHDGLWDGAEFEDREVFLDDMFSILRGDKHLQRDRVMLAVGMAGGMIASKAKMLGYESVMVRNYDRGQVSRAIELPDSYQVALVLSLGKSVDSRTQGVYRGAPRASMRHVNLQSVSYNRFSQ